MHETIQKMARAFAKQREQRRRACAGFTALALLVSISTTYLLGRPANTMAADYYCGYEAHIHTEECYQRVLICGYDTEDNTVSGGGGIEWLPPEFELPEGVVPPAEGEIPVEGELPVTVLIQPAFDLPDAECDIPAVMNLTFRRDLNIYVIKLRLAKVMAPPYARIVNMKVVRLFRSQHNRLFLVCGKLHRNRACTAILDSNDDVSSYRDRLIVFQRDTNLQVRLSESLHIQIRNHIYIIDGNGT